jgi:small subunit ribosomal protein S8|uniref:Ribosomal protein S8 n=1 Tax=Heterosigma akashiwo TaxID=2829 RepID=D2Z234_HETAK|nr:ribosomal protein S8 [Heterosigma akashiwo]ACS27144.1 ribosomal protein S8 [Heterosigma akashiwo]ACS27183.1 ribosomal protein S8 [Heterosigma akashiwo]AOT84811.1 ribosomal protein small subunit 8 [Heterosigma akashiwo]AOT84853.1 ribosomal protein small subunit 8 [Heterosigma akashiwo]AOT84895.1 ribosomal protein small subunit 8 [Heterosigma akashiwo]|mmetsp:Transcript_46130/g.67358  ORF Transcript_46130/g.67358 Transcript_46130/m.67358 type:complete len:129 (-) Transcript_46130:1971-2357(-)
MIVFNPIYDMLTRIRNGQLARKEFVCQPKNNLCLKILEIIYKEGYIKHYSLKDNNTIQIWLKYLDASPTIKKVSFFSTGKKSTFLSLPQLWKIDSELKLYILSTNKGFLSGRSSRKKKVGGKLICIVE